jgi:hypothetical protein
MHVCKGAPETAVKLLEDPVNGRGQMLEKTADQIGKSS